MSTTGILVTNGGPHPAEKWAEATSTYIVEISESISGPASASAIKLQAAVIDILIAAHTTVQDGERVALASDPATLNSVLCAANHLSVAAVVQEIVGAGVGTPWQDSMATPEFAAQVAAILESHLHSSMHVERSWLVDSSPDSPHAQAFRAAHNVGV